MGFSGLVCLTAVELRGSRGVFLLILALLYRDRELLLA